MTCLWKERVPLFEFKFPSTPQYMKAIGKAQAYEHCLLFCLIHWVKIKNYKTIPNSTKSPGTNSNLTIEVLQSQQNSREKEHGWQTSHRQHR